jgi:hypothetical protein
MFLNSHDTTPKFVPRGVGALCRSMFSLALDAMQKDGAPCSIVMTHCVFVVIR